MTQFVRITWPNGQSETRTMQEFCGDPSPHLSRMRAEILHILERDNTITLINDQHPGQKIRIDLIQRGALN